MLLKIVKKNCKKQIQQILKKFHIHSLYVPPGRLTNFDLNFDLTVIIPEKSPVCIDIGANKGQTIDKFTTIFNSPYIYAFEPSTEVFKKLHETYSSSEIKIINVAMGDHEGKKEFINYMNPALSSFLKIDKNKQNVFSNQKEINREIVQIETIDSFLNKEKIEIVHLLKSDTQGYELEVLKGALNSLRDGKIKNILVELNFIPMYEKQANYQEIIAFCENLGFQLINFYEIVRIENTIAWCTALFGKNQHSK